MRRLAVALAAFLAAITVVPFAAAEQPQREPLPAPPTIMVSGSCSFDVRIDVLVNKEFITTFASGKQLITGRLVVRVTNAARPGNSRVLQISGPGKEDLSTPSVFNLSGNSLIFFPGTFVLTRGPVSLTFDEAGNVVSFTQTSASSVDVCALLA